MSDNQIPTHAYRLIRDIPSTLNRHESSRQQTHKIKVNDFAFKWDKHATIWRKMYRDFYYLNPETASVTLLRTTAKNSKLKL